MFSNQDMPLQVKKAISPTTLNTLSMVTDPYHDYNIQATGFPDGQSAFTCVRRFQGLTTITCPFVLGAGEKWRFTVFTTGLHQVSTMLGGSFSNGLIVETGSYFNFGPVTIKYDHLNASNSLIAVKYEALGPAGDAASTSVLDRSRVVSLGFELHNITPELYRGGSLTSYRMNASTEPVMCRYQPLIPSGSIYPYAGQLLANLPVDTVTTATLPNVRTWEAAAGVYAVALPPANNPFSSPSGDNKILATYFANGSGNLTQTCFITPKLETGTYSGTGSILNNVGTLSSIFTDANTVFTLDYRMILETQTVGLSPLIAFCTKPLPYDRVFLKLYKNMLSTIPSAVPVGFNDAGEWFRRIMKIASAALPLIANVLPPQAKAVATVAGPVLGLLSQAGASKTQQQPNKTGRMLPAKKQLKK
jgi:hypothetical protein